MADGLQSILVELGLAMAPFRAVKTHDQAVSFLRQLGDELPLGAAGLHPRQGDAVRYWIRAQWHGRVPDDRIGINGTFKSNLHTPWLVEHHQVGLNIPPFALSPTRQYHAHIVTWSA